MKKIIKLINAPTKIIIADPYYLETIENNQDKGCEKELCLIKKRLPKTMNTEIIIEEKEETYDGFNITSIYVDIIAVSDKLNEIEKIKMKKVFEDNCYYPKKVSKEGSLGCDTACFIVETNKGYNEFKTGADGYYGDYIFYKNNEGYHIGLVFDSDLFDIDELISIFEYLFK